MSETPLAQNSDTISTARPWLKAHAFQPGQSGNPGGRPKRKPLTEELEKVLAECGRDPQQRTYARRLVESAVKRAIKKDTFALKEIWERVEGKVPQAITGADGGPVQFQVNVMYGGSAPQDIVVEAISADNDAIDAAIESPEAIESIGDAVSKS